MNSFPSTRMIYVRRTHTFLLSILLLLVVATFLFCVTVHGQTENVNNAEDDSTLSYEDAIKKFQWPSLSTTVSYNDPNQFEKNIKDVFGVFTSSTTRSSTNIDEKTDVIDNRGNQESLQQTECYADGETCTPYYACNNKTTETDSEPFIDIRLQVQNSCPSMYVCCSESMKNNASYTVSEMDNRIKCGHRNSNGIGPRISTFSSEAQFSEFPWMVAVLKSDLNNTYFCGASLIHPSVVLTATHCLNNKNLDQLVLRAGEWDSQSRSEIYPHQDRYVSKVIKHDYFNATSLVNNIALIFLDKPFILRDNVGTVCLPPQDFNYKNETCYASGWGKDVFGKEGVYQNILKKIDLGIVPRYECLRRLRKTRLGPNFELPNMFVCAGGVIGKDTCKGDGGGPLMCPTPDNNLQYHQAGIVSWGIGCNSEVPGVYTDVAKFRNWIDEQFIAEGLDPSYYEASYEVPQIN